MTTAKDTCVAILAGGRGERLQSVVSDRPKVLAPVCGRPFLSYLLDRINATGVGKVIICVGYMADAVIQEFGDSYKDLSIVYSRETEPLGTAGALRLAMPLFTTDPVLVYNGDSFCEFWIRNFFIAWEYMRPSGLIVAIHVDDTSRYGSMLVDGYGHITTFREKSKTLSSEPINAGIYLLGHELLEMIPAGKSCSLEHDIFPKLCDGSLCAHETNGSFIDIGTPESYAMAERFFQGVK